LDADRLPEPTELGFGTWRCQSSNPGLIFVRDNSMTDMELTSSRVWVIRALFSEIGCDKRRCDGRGGSEARD
jgi:hypothetical protein